MFVPVPASKKRSESVRVSFPGSVMAELQAMATEANVEVSEIVRQMVNFALASRQEVAAGGRVRKSSCRTSARRDDPPHAE